MTMLRRSLIMAAALAALAGGTAAARAEAPSSGQNYTPIVGQAGKDVVWVPTSQPMVDRMLDMAGLTRDDILVDLGSGDGVTVITAALRGATARGVEFNPDMVALARQRAEQAGVSKRATFKQGDIFETDFSDATVVTLFLLPQLNLKLRPILLDMTPGTRIVANSFDMGDWEPDETATVTQDCSSFCNALKWIVPAKVEGAWELDGKRLELTQAYQKVSGALRDGASAQPLADGRLEGTSIRFSIGADRYEGEVSGGKMRGTVNGSRSWQAAKVAGS